MSAESPTAVDVGALRAELATWLQGLATTASPGAMSATRLEMACASVDPYAWLDAQSTACQVLWEGRDDGVTVAGVGRAHVVHASGRSSYAEVLDCCRADLGDSAGARMYGGFAFRRAPLSRPPWDVFGSAWFVLPQFELLVDGTGCRLACNVVADSDGSPLDATLAAFDALSWRLVAAEALPPIIGRRDVPDAEGWRRNVSHALDLIASDTLEKIVLARKASYAFESAASAAHILRHLRPVTNTCYHFLMQPDRSAAFMGTSPERLFARHDRELRSDIIAGTRPCVGDPEADEALGRDLLASEKDQREHDIVRKSVRQRLHLLCEALRVDDEAHLLRLERKQHLYSTVQARLRPEITDAILLDALHPTPAVGGYPTDVAVAEIQRLEGFRRGWYASPVGWVGPEACEFAVAIRSGLVVGAQVDVYSGAGIVAGSDADAEWEEIENKISDFVTVTAARGE